MITLCYTENPRRLVLVPPANKTKVGLVIESDRNKNCSVKYSETRLNGLKPFPAPVLYGCIGIVAVMDEIFLGVITDAGRIAEFEGHEIFVVNRVDFYCVSNNKYDRFNPELQGGDTNAQIPVHPCSQLIKLLSSGSFYFSHTFDLTRDLKSRLQETEQNMMDSQNLDYVWNKSIMSELQRIKRTELDGELELSVNSSGILVSIIQGFVGFQLVTIAGQRWKMGIISRYLLVNQAKF